MDRKELLRILENIKPGITSNDTTSLMAYFYFSGEDVISYNNKISVQYPLKTDFSLFIKASDLHKILSKLTADTVTLSEKDNKLNIKCATLNADLATVQDEETAARIETVKKSLKGAEWKQLPTNFCEAILLCSLTASNSESEGTLTCVNVDGQDCISSDNKRISHSIMDTPVDQMFIRASEVKNLIGMNPMEYAIQKSWIHFKNDEGCIFSIIKTKGEYPEFLEFFEFEGNTIKLPKKIAEGMDIASIFTNDTDPVVSVKISKGAIFISVRSEAGTVKYRTKLDYSGDDFTFSINPEFLKQMMSHSSYVTIGEGKTKITTEDGNYSMVTSLYAD